MRPLRMQESLFFERFMAVSIINLAVHVCMFCTIDMCVVSDTKFPQG